VSLDGSDFRIYEPTPFDTKWFSHKFKGPGIRYEVGLNISTGDIVWVNGGVPCGAFPDLVLARECYIYNVNEGELTVADETYEDRRYFIYPKAYPESVHWQKAVMARHETVNKKMADWGCLGKRFRHRLELHQLCFYAVANLTQVLINLGEKLYDVGAAQQEDDEEEDLVV